MATGMARRTVVSFATMGPAKVPRSGPTESTFTGMLDWANITLPAVHSVLQSKSSFRGRLHNVGQAVDVVVAQVKHDCHVAGWRAWGVSSAVLRFLHPSPR